MNNPLFTLNDLNIIEQLVSHARNADPCNPDYLILYHKVRDAKDNFDRSEGLEPGVMNI